MPEDTSRRLLQMPHAQLVDLALVGLSRQGKMVAGVIEWVQEQIGEFMGTTDYARIYLVGCGDSYFAALSSRYSFERLTGLPTMALESMEFAHYTLLLPDSLVIVISSGGESSATLKAGSVARKAGLDIIGVVAHERCPMAQELHCLTTTPGLSDTAPQDQAALMLGNFSFSLAALYLIAVHIGQSRGYLNDEAKEKIEADINAVPYAIDRAMDRSAEVHEYIEQVGDDADFYFLGAGPSYGVALFYQAKFFEQARRPVYGVELEEFAHEQFFLLQPDQEAHVWFIAPAGHSRERVLQVMAGCQDMDACTVAVASPDESQIHGRANLAFQVETTPEMFSPLVTAVPGELLGIYAFARWEGGLSFASRRHLQMAASRKLTREKDQDRLERSGTGSEQVPAVENTSGTLSGEENLS